MSEARAGRGAQGRVGSVINGKWQVDARIGSGGMATVYAATHRNGHRAALKMLHSQLSRDPSTRARFLREGYVANAVAHPGIVAVLDDGIAEDGSAFLVLELLEGETIDARRTRLGGKLPVEEALDVADQALEALAAAHEKGIVHRDVKPENVFLTNEGQIKLLDFGLARMKDGQAETTKTGVTIGTPEFMPPEQATGRRDAVDARSDVWGLGATLFTTITGRYVHDDAQSIHEQLIASATVRPKPIRQFAPHLSPAIANVIDRALELEIDDRWPSARDMQAALRAARARSPSVLTGDSMTVLALPMPSSKPLPHDEVVLPDKTTEMASVPSTARDTARPKALPLRKIEDATDMEETVVDEGRAGPRSRRSPLESNTPVLGINQRMNRAERAGEPSPPVGVHSRPPPSNAFRGRFQSPSGEHVLVQAPTSSHAVHTEDDAHAETVAISSPLPLPADVGLGPPKRSPRAFPTSTAPPPLPPQPAPPAPAPPAPPQSPAVYAPPPHLSAPPDGVPPLSAPRPVLPQTSSPLGATPTMTNPPSTIPEHQPSSGRVILLVSLALIAICAAMGSYVFFWRRTPSAPK